MVSNVMERPVPAKTKEFLVGFVEQGNSESLDRVLGRLSKKCSEDVMESLINELWTINYLNYMDTSNRLSSPDGPVRIMRTLWKYTNPNSQEYQFY